jgi:hypothetical protein
MVMDRMLFGLTILDWIFLGSAALVPFLMALGIYMVRKEMRLAARLKAKPVRLKTTESQRRQWRLKTQSRDLIDLLDDIDTLLKRLEEG